MVTIKYKESFNFDYFEEITWAQGGSVIGLDEAGRGCLAGPVVCAAAMLFPGKKHPLIKDSKKLTENQRNEAYFWLKDNAVFQYAIIDHYLVDRYNIYQATLKGMQRAAIHFLEKNSPIAPLILVDAMPVVLSGKYSHLDVYHFNYGEDRSSSIAAASIIAKVTRDAIMKDLDKAFPLFQFAQNKGYGTQKHKKIIEEHFHVSIHRQAFID